MPRFICSICSAPPDVLQAVNNALLAGESGRKIAARSAFGKSSLYRHREKCLPRETLRKHRDKLLATAQPGRVIVQWPDDYNGPALTTVKHGSCVPFDEDFNEADILIVVRFVTTPLSEIGNPSALLTEGLFDEAVSEHRARFPSAFIASEVSETNTNPVRISECVAADDTFSDATPCEVGDRKIEVCNTNINSEPPAPELTPTCEHVWTNIAANTRRCQQCGFQENAFQVFILDFITLELAVRVHW